MRHVTRDTWHVTCPARPEEIVIVAIVMLIWLWSCVLFYLRSATFLFLEWVLIYPTPQGGIFITRNFWLHLQLCDISKVKYLTKADIHNICVWICKHLEFRKRKSSSSDLEIRKLWSRSNLLLEHIRCHFNLLVQIKIGPTLHLRYLNSIWHSDHALTLCDHWPKMTV